MFKLLRFHHIAVVAGLCATTACSKDDPTRENAENAAEAVRERSEDLKENAGDLKETANDVAEDTRERAADTAEKTKDNVEDLKDETKPLTKDAVALRDAQKEFEYQRMVRVQNLRTTHAIAASQPVLINGASMMHAIEDDDRSKLAEKLNLMRTRLDDSANLIQGLGTAEANHWEARDRAVSEAMKRLEEVRSDAWEALDEADRLTSMR